jgi:6,7-dimethyl-8-ribityllumazine synthase
MPQTNIAIIVADYHQAIASAMEASALDEAKRLKMKVQNTYRVTGSYEVPLLAQVLLKRKNIDALVVLGFIEKGETLHGEVMGNTVSQSLIQLSLQEKKPIGLGIIGPGATLAQAEKRKVGYAKAAVAVLARVIPVLQSAKKQVT